MTAHLSILKEQTGQAIVFVLAMLTVILVSTVFLYQSGRITTEKMELQNAADAAAMTASVLEARALNFSAYINRAMVANEIAIGQGVGLLSFASELESFEKYLTAYAAAITAASVGTAAPVATVLQKIGSAIGKVGRSMENVLKKIVPYWIKAFYAINRVYSISQNVYHYATAGLVMDGIGKSLEENVTGTEYGNNFLGNLVSPPEENARSAPVSLVGLATHFNSYLNGYTKRLSQEDEESELPTGIGRFAGVVREGRDDFSSGAGTNTRHWGLSIDAGADVGLFKLNVGLSAGSEGGSEVIRKQDRFIWSAADVADIKANIEFMIRIFLPGETIEKGVPIPSPSLPMGVGGYQAEGGTQSLTAGDLNGAKKPNDPEGFGGVANGMWFGLAKQQIRKNKVSTSPYGGLPAYRDVDRAVADSAEDEEEETNPFAFPFFLIAVEKDYDQLKSQGPQFAGKLDTGEGESFDRKVAAVAKSRVYFSRPDDLDHFVREDGNLEKGNLFSPFWQARLVDTRDEDRFLILALQQGKVWFSLAAFDGLPTESITNVIRALESFLRLLP